jgi:hypothetical protein
MISGYVLSQDEVDSLRNLGIKIVSSLKEDYEILVMKNLERRVKSLLAISKGT